MLYYSINSFLTLEQEQVNALFVARYLISRGWTLNAIAGMLGNMQTESNINPGIWQNLDAYNYSLGFGIVQWTPATKYIDWANARGYTIGSMEAQLTRLQYEMDNHIQYYPTSAYPLTFAQFKVSTNTPEWLAQAFLLNYERPADQTQPQRSTQARYWYDYLKPRIISGGTTVIPTGTDYPKFKKGSYPIFLLGRKKRS